ncbi:C2H2-type zinc finger protein [Candidatus Sororendozoicomonas aggregata]|uniref:C2H2-type zinc finger protein n=1 Tax=Candidatus Sororendozoicomonas aggregata TaxID=3073239 RepID=UPI002ED2C23E
MPKPKVKKQYICKVCGKSLSRGDLLNNHMRGHEGIKRYKCTTCGKEFTTGSNLGKHLRTHTGQKPYKCKFCSKTFADRSNCTTHMKLHAAIKPHQCSICGKCFSRKHHLIDHQGSSKCIPDSTPSSSAIKTTTQPLGNGEVAVCTTNKVIISDDLVLRFSCITSSEGTATVTTQQHRGAVVTTVEQEEPTSSAENVTPGLKDPEIDPMWSQFDDPIDDSPTTSVLYTGDLGMGDIEGDIDFDPEDSLPEIPGMPDMTN